MPKSRFLKDNVLVVVLAGGEGSRLMPLTETRTKPAVPIGAKFRLIDIPLSNAANSGLTQALILTQGKDKSLNRHIKDTWYSDRHRRGFIDIISPQGVGKTYQGDADAVRQIRNDIRNVNSKYVLIVPGDHLLKMDYMKFVIYMLDHNADAAISIATRPFDQAGQLGSLSLDEKGRIIELREKDPHTDLAFMNEKGEKVFYASMGIYAFKSAVLLDLLEEKGALFGHDLIPKLVGVRDVIGYPYELENIIYDEGIFHINDMAVSEVDISSDSGYWRDVGTISEYFQANMDLTGITPVFNLYGVRWPFFTYRDDFGPAKIIRSEGNSCIDAAIVGESSFLSNVHGKRLVISSQVYIDRSELNNVIVFNKSTIQRCRIQNTIIDKNVHLANMEIGYDEEYDLRRGIYIDPMSKVRVVPKNYDFAVSWFNQDKTEIFAPHSL